METRRVSGSVAAGIGAVMAALSGAPATAQGTPAAFEMPAEWELRLDRPIGGVEDPRALATARDQLFVTGSSTTYAGVVRQLTAAFELSDGSCLWSHVPAAPPEVQSRGWDLALAPGGAFACVVGDVDAPQETPPFYDMVTTRFDPATGAVVWSVRHDHGPGPVLIREDGRAVAVGPDGARVYVTGIRRVPWTLFPLSLIHI